jgi:hypothetical protein
LAVVSILTIGAAMSPVSSVAHAAPGRPSSWTGSTALAVLRSVADTASNRTSIVINDFGAIWRAAGLPVPPTLHQWETKTASDATSQAAPGSPAGSYLWQLMPEYSAPLGYPVLSLDGELDVGPPADDLSEVWGPITQPAVRKAFKKANPHTTMVGADLVLGLGSPSEVPPPPFDAVLLATRFVAAPKAGGRLVTGGRRASLSAVKAVVDNAPMAHPLSRDPSVLAVLGAFGPTFESLAIGTSFIAKLNVVLHNPSVEERADFEHTTGLSQFQVGPVMVGLAYIKGAPQAKSVVAAALYPTPAAAQTAATTVARYTVTGESVQSREPYRQLWRVDRTRVHGSLVVMDLTTKLPGSATTALIDNDFPLFWSP